MSINGRKLYDFLMSKEIKNLYHANTVTTSATFLENKGLLSRGYVDDNGLEQTPQSSDKKDKEVGVWYHIFLDVTDLHNNGFGVWNRQNMYGPVLFVIDSKILLDTNLPDISITKTNPIHFNSKVDNYCISLDEYINDFANNTYEKMIIIEAENYILKFYDYLQEIIIDSNVNINGVNYSQMAFNVITKLVNKEHINCKVRYRICNPRCFCLDNYRDISKLDLENLFFLLSGETNERF